MEVRIIFRIKKTIPVIFLVFLFGSFNIQEVFAEQVSSESVDQKKIKAEGRDERIKNFFEAVYERNRTLKKSPEWLSNAYSGLKIKKLNDISKEEYKSYKKYLIGDNIYFIVHPAWYVFFDPNKAETVPKEDMTGFSSKNYFERFVDQYPPDDLAGKILKEQERLLRDFLEFMSSAKKLVVLVLPKDYKVNLHYGYKSETDEFARYINDLSNMSESIIYIESQKFDNGIFEGKDLETLVAFLNEIGAKKMFLGGGYLGKCLDDFYVSMRTKYRYEDVYFVPELTDISPRDMPNTDTGAVLTKDQRINFNTLKKFYKVSTEEIPQFKELSLYKVYR